MNTLVILDDEEQLKTLDADKIRNKKIISLNQSIISKDIVPFIDYIQNFDIEDECIQWIKNFSNKKINDKSLKEYFYYEKLSLWWFMESWLYYSYIYHDSFKDVLTCTKIVSLILENEKPKKIIFLGKNQLYKDVIEEFCKSKGIDFKICGELNIQKNNLKLIASKVYIKYKPIIRKIFYSFKKITNHTKGILFINYTEGSLESNLVLNKLKSICEEKIMRIDVARGSNPGLKLSPFLENDLVPFEKYLTRNILKNIKKETKNNINKWKSIKNLESFRDNFKYSGINIFKFVEKQMSYYFNSRLYGHLLDYETSKNMIETIKPKVVFIPTIYTPFEIGLIASCKLNKIPVINMQPGIINKYYPDYVHNKSEISKNNDLEFPFYPLPTKICVFGDYYKEFLIKYGCHPKDVPVVTGIPRYDSLIKSVNKKDIINDLKINSEEKVIVLATQPFTLIKEREDFLRLVYRVIKNIDNSRLIVKIHPSEGNFELHNKIAEGVGIKNVIFLKDYNLLNLLSVCDLLITAYSTVGLEAMVLDKPVITINLSGMPDKVDYAEEGAAIGVKNEAELVKAIKLLLYDQKTKDILAKNRKKYVYEHCYKIDGKSSERVARAIKGLIK